ncbi:transglycosylase family protein [Kitasatospora sp. NPDC048365]|uniref:LysM peptidoglycan-binding domain-containing protein n=1 Tax=Kitasatospora sp. NPDC048365 TaxID=3364050 RepID=UPI00370FBF18
MIFRNETATATATTENGGRKRNRLRAAIVAGTAVAVLPVAGLVAATSASAAPVSTWDKVAQCESTGDWSINTGNGFYGGLQFTSSTWAAYGGTQYAAQANQATKAQQISVAEKVLADQGPGAWPVCSVQAGLTKGGAAAEVDTSSSSTAAKSTTSKSTTDSSASTGDSSAKASRSESRAQAPQAQQAPQAAEQNTAAGSYTVKSGDTLSAIAGANGTSTDALYAKNAQTIGSNPDVIYPGQVLSV